MAYANYAIVFPSNNAARMQSAGRRNRMSRPGVCSLITPLSNHVAAITPREIPSKFGGIEKATLVPGLSLRLRKGVHPCSKYEKIPAGQRCQTRSGPLAAFVP